MSAMIGSRPPAWFWLVAVLALLWEAFGVATYLMHVGMLPDMMEVSAAERQLAESMPDWATAGYAVAVFAGLLGALGLLMRKGWSRTLLFLSLLGLLVQFGWWVLMSGARTIIGPSSMIMPGVVILVGVFLVWFANHAAKRGWLS